MPNLATRFYLNAEEAAEFFAKAGIIEMFDLGVELTNLTASHSIAILTAERIESQEFLRLRETGAAVGECEKRCRLTEEYYNAKHAVIALRREKEQTEVLERCLRYAIRSRLPIENVVP